jgi:DHA2 family multidrug resistance protein
VLSPETAQGALALSAEISRQALMVAYLNDFRLMTLVCALCVPLVLILRRPRGENPPGNVVLVE